ncbi:MAG TPA: 50S ribosomal protein L24 [Patescibacteria group bacterium]|nr:50S ribosomal protein L24 [Patescibacteria group bacterium]
MTDSKTKIKKFKKEDNVKVVSGKEKGKTGKIEKVLHKEKKVLITGLNQYKKHVKAKAQGQKSEIITITKPLPITNIAIICPKCHKQTRVGFKIEKNQKIRICRKCKAEL